MGCGASAAPGGGEEGGGRALKTVSSGDIDKAIATGRSGLVKNQRKAVAMLLSMVVINSVIRERIASEVRFLVIKCLILLPFSCLIHLRAAYTPWLLCLRANPKMSNATLQRFSLIWPRSNRFACLLWTRAPSPPCSTYFSTLSQRTQWQRAKRCSTLQCTRRAACLPRVTRSPRTGMWRRGARSSRKAQCRAL